MPLTAHRTVTHHASRRPALQPADAIKTAQAADRQVEHDARHARIAVAAYLRAEKRGFSPGAELDDWLAAEREIDRKTAVPRPAVT